MTGTYRRITAALAIAVLGCAGSALLANGIYKSVDAQGHVVFSDQPDLSAAQTSTVVAPDTASAAEVEVRVTEAPPPLPEEQPPPDTVEGDLWTPGYWAWSAAGYYWVPGVWVPAPQVGLLWTPGYWVYVDAVYVFRRGYWAEHVGYYGGIAYGHGYWGQGFTGGRWVGRAFVTDREADAGRGARSRVSYNNGPGGTSAAPTAQELAFASRRHLGPTAAQRQALAQAARMPTLVASQAAPHPRMQENPRAAQQVAAMPRHVPSAAPPPVRQAPPPAVRTVVPPRTPEALATRAKAPAIRHSAPTVSIPGR